MLFESSLPLRKCGLKSNSSSITVTRSPSLPLRKCGLKFYDYIIYHRVLFVTSLAEVWIEMVNLMYGSPNFTCHFPCGSVDWNFYKNFDNTAPISHFPCGSVDWNYLLCYFSPLLWLVTSLAEVWIEIVIMWHKFSYPVSLPLRKCGLKYEKDR